MKIVNGIEKWKHTKFHESLIKKHGNATKCESVTCTHKNPKRFEWALKHGHKYSNNPKDYLQLCVSCHRKYDFTEEIRNKLRAAKVGEKNNRAKLMEKDVLNIHKLIIAGIQNKNIAKKYKINPSTICDIKRGKRWPHLYELFHQSK